ncbi:hypothetical protein [Paenibacillus sp. Leaf72]|uniref:hypothetical protein n=1 Tax=Paenibacillus sp. Leaf72 TaxID=1736234 RepID=UPI0006FA35E4|nr:hypothetical protein [Paenibacillus sp. Leaf72]KQO00614.1 hypothetical protein ASF12_17780 [Paenibacillus sp. Leaf72]
MIKKVFKITTLSTLVVTLSACSVLKEAEPLTSEQAQAYTNATANKYQTIFKGRGQTVVFANGTSLHYEIAEDHIDSMGGENDGDWVVKESAEQLIASVNGEKINITDALEEKGYFYYGYRDDADILHRLYIVKNAGGTKDYAERWYSQAEWLPELGMSGGSRGLSGPLAMAIGSAEQDVNDDNAEHDTALQKHLKHYWNEYGEESF